jgi:hypothetical protein
MPTTIKLVGVEQAIANLAQLPRKVALRHLRVALSAAGGKIKDVAKVLAPVETKTLRNALTVKVKIPDASWDVKHHGRPAYVLIGAKRGGTGDRQVSSWKGKIRRVTGKSLERAHAFGLRVRVRRPSRYSHLAEKKHRFHANAARIAGPVASQRAADKLAKAFETEAAALPK